MDMQGTRPTHGRRKLSLEEIAQIPRDYIVPWEAAGVLGVDPYSLNIAAKAGRLNLEHVLVGTRLKIAKIPFLERMGYEG